MTLQTDSRPHVLLIDDDEDEYFLLSQALAVYSTHLVLDQLITTDQLMTSLLGLTQLPALILLDFNVPPGNALDVLTILRQDERTRAIPVVVRSGSLQGDQVSQCYQAGANSVLLKSDNQAKLVETTRRLCQYWFEEALLPDRSEGTH